ncbi:MAG: hypothetical protein R3C45_02065 [Phycisphaerales bacterium]
MISQLLDMAARPSAVIVVSGTRAIALYRACQQRGLKIPQGPFRGDGDRHGL